MTGEKKIFKVGFLFDGHRIVGKCRLYVDNGMVAGIVEGLDGPSELPNFADAEIIDEPGGMIIPGLVNCHHHAYSALARGLVVKGPMNDFPSILSTLWWPLDRALDEEALDLSALVTGVACVKRGSTALIDHHSSPGCVNGSLEILGKAFRKCGLRAALCFEVSDRNGPGVFSESVEENLAFFNTHKNDNTLKGMMGLHASFTLSGKSLEKIALEKPDDLPIHVHLAEDVCDVKHAKELGFAGPLDRLDAYGLLDSLSLAAHGVHLSRDEIERAGSLGLNVVRNEASNFNNNVGYSNPDLFDQGKLLLGTDGMGSDMVGAARFSYLCYMGLGGRAVSGVDLVGGILFNNGPGYMEKLFGRSFGRIQPGLPADFVLFDYDPPTPLEKSNFHSHFLYGITDNFNPLWVYSGGDEVLRDGEIAFLDERALEEEAREKALEIRRKLEE